MTVPFNKPYLAGKEAQNMLQSISSGHLSGNGMYTKLCSAYFTQRWSFAKCLMTTSCTDALEMSAMLSGIKQGDEVIIPSYTFVTTALAFIRQGAKVIFIDSRPDHPGIDESQIESLITSKTKVIVPVHYAGVACDMDVILNIASLHNLLVVEDAAQSIDSYYKGRPLGGIGHLGAFSFHETKNIQCGEGGMLVVTDERFHGRAEIIWEKGTNRSEFFRGEVDKYGWVDIGSSFLPADYVAGFLYAQLDEVEKIQIRRKEIWTRYYEGLKGINGITLPVIPDYATNNAHMFYCLCRDLNERTRLISFLKNRGIHSVFHYICLHSSPYYSQYYTGAPLSEAKRYEETLVRLPMYYELTDAEVDEVISSIADFF
jgi:dTDP-4-amino-4,6-dideoxygalactose transaminase